MVSDDDDDDDDDDDVGHHDHHAAGLYLVSVGVIKPLVWLADLTGKVVCSTAMLRFVNLLFNGGNLYLLYLLTCKLHPREKGNGAARRILSALSLSTFPVLYFFTFLYYTDAGSTFFVLFAYLMTLYGCHGASALLGACAVLFRQTNIVWVAFCAGTLLAGRLDEAWLTEHTKKRDERPSRVPLSLAGAKRVAVFLLESLTSPAHLRALLAVAWPYAAVAVGFLVFLAVNGGVVVGDRTSHEACLHVPQLFYFLCFTLAFAMPAVFCRHRLLRFAQALRHKPLLFLFLTAAGLLLVWCFTHAHPYLLADNRHYTFYVWSRVFRRYAAARYLLVPAYVFAGWHFLDSLRSRALFWTLALLVCLLAATVPQRLLEFRYFIVPFLMYRLHVPLPSLPRLLLELALYAAVNGATLYLFLARPFLWPGSADTQRFMW
ncbi:hypothetical protein CRUP_014400 [Coryphaenoides rupestris]|nr:hypothetical protein CRUP_014400 [Coryphaenoides rupestris]